MGRRSKAADVDALPGSSARLLTDFLKCAHHPNRRLDRIARVVDTVERLFASHPRPRHSERDRLVELQRQVGGGLRTLEEMRAVLLAGAEKVSIDSGAVRNPALITEGARAFGSQCVVLSMQVKRSGNPQCPSGCEVMIDGGRTPTGLDALAWSREGERLGAGELCINSIDADGTKAGYDLEITRMIADGVGIPVIASGGAGEPRHLLDAFTAGGADAAIVASIVHYGECTIPDLKRYLRAGGVEIREAIHLEERSGT